MSKKRKKQNVTPKPQFQPKPVTARTQNQKTYLKSINENKITFCLGPAGCGKTHLAVGMAVDYLRKEKVEKIIITRPVVEAGEKLGFLPGAAEEKLKPYLLPIYDELAIFASQAEIFTWINSRQLQMVPLALMRGRNFHDSFIILDEGQNASYQQVKMLLTRIGRNSRLVLSGDIEQSDLPKFKRGGLKTMFDVLHDVVGVGVVNLDNTDIVREEIVGLILEKLEQYENGQEV